jgi:hypothetical protein
MALALFKAKEYELCRNFEGVRNISISRLRQKVQPVLARQTE